MQSLRIVLSSCLLGLALASHGASASGWLWDRDGNAIDDRIEAVIDQGIHTAFEGHDPENGRLRFAVFEGEPLSFGVYVGYDHHPTDSDVDALEAAGVDPGSIKAYQSIDYLRTRLTWAQINAVAALDGVSRIESVPIMYALNNNATKTSGAVDSGFRRFPTVQGNLDIRGRGVVVGILDTGVNDAPEDLTGYPGHEAVAGKFLGGGNFFAGQPALNTGTGESENPVDRGEAAASNHGTHVAGTAIGTGGPSALFGGVAPAAGLVDLKVLSDAGAGFGSADGVDWAVANRDRYGIRVLNLSLGGTDASDGTDASSQAINAAAAAGLVSVIATGNDGNTDYMPSPAAADRAISVGAIADFNTIGRDDDLIADYSNEGPRADDGDGEFVDEMKPEVAAPGSGIISADGSLLTDGRQYKALSGTSMATPHVAGIVALMLEANPSLTPEQVDAILRHTAEHRNQWGKTSPEDNPYPAGDPNYHPSGGWGQVDAYAAVKEALRLAGDPTSQTQVVAISAEPAVDDPGAIDLTWVTQREIALEGFEVYRAPDVGGAPGSFALISDSLIPGRGSAVIEGTENRTRYVLRDAGLTPDRVYWYRIEHRSSDPAVGTVQEPPIAVTLGSAPAVARLEYSITHDAFSNDLLVLLGTGPQAERANFIIDGLSPNQADSVSEEPGEATLGTQRYEFSLDLTTLQGVEEFLPPSKHNPWWLMVKEGGYVNRSGRVNSFSLILLDANGEATETFATGDLTPVQTVEGSTTMLWIPDDPSLAEPGDQPTLIEIAPDTADAGQTVSVDLYGAEFLPGAGVSVAGDGVTVEGVTYDSGSRLMAKLVVDASASAGPRDVTVTNLDGGSDTLPAAFTVAGDGDTGGDPKLTAIEDDDPAVEYQRGWHRVEAEQASGGGYHRRMGSAGGNSPDPTTRLVFEGSQVTYHYGTSEIGGSADLYIDGDAVATGFSYAGDAPHDAPRFGDSVTFDDLGAGSHELLIVHRGGAAYVDGFDIVSGEQGGADAAAPARRPVTSRYSAEPALLSGSVAIDLPVEADVEHISVVVDGLLMPALVELIDDADRVLASGDELIGGAVISGVDLPNPPAGTVRLRILDPVMLGDALQVSVAQDKSLR